MALHDELRQFLFEAGQYPTFWFSSAQKLMRAAEIVFRDQTDAADEYEKALDEASYDVESTGMAEIKADSPVFRPAELLYGFAIENLLKGLIVADNPGLISQTELDKGLRTHDLIKLAARAKIALTDDETRVATILSLMNEWAGRYPVAAKVEKHAIDAFSDLLDWRRDHLIIRRLYERIAALLESELDHPPQRYGMIVLVEPEEGS
jgi:hypothetical protein